LNSSAQFLAVKQQQQQYYFKTSSQAGKDHLML